MEITDTARRVTMAVGLVNLEMGILLRSKGRILNFNINFWRANLVLPSALEIRFERNLELTSMCIVGRRVLHKWLGGLPTHYRRFSKRSISSLSGEVEKCLIYIFIEADLLDVKYRFELKTERFDDSTAVCWENPSNSDSPWSYNVRNINSWPRTSEIQMRCP